jgi:hypothetical protein
VAAELLERLGSVAPEFFERLVVQLLVAMGYGGSYAEAASVVGRPGDEGIDGVIKEDPLGLDAVYVQAKRWQGVVGRPEIQRFAGGLEGVRARKGVFITTTVAVQSNSMAYQIAVISLGVGSTFLCWLLFRTRLVPRFLAVWGLVGYAIYLAGAIAEISGTHIGLILSIPGGLFEVGFALWLIVKGFQPEAYRGQPVMESAA